MPTIKQTLGINSQKELDSLPNPWPHPRYQNPLEWLDNIRWFFSMEDLYTDPTGFNNPMNFDPPLSYDPPLVDRPNNDSLCPQQAIDAQIGWARTEDAKGRYNCNPNYPKHFTTKLFALARIEERINGQPNVRQFIEKHWDVDEWSSCWDSDIISDQCLDEIKDHGKELADMLNIHFSNSVTEVHLNEFWDPRRKREYHKFQEGLKENATTFSVVSNAMQASSRTIGKILYDNYMDDYIQSTDDAICIHPYSFSKGEQDNATTNYLNQKPEEMYWGAPQGKYPLVADLVTWKNANYPNKPIWITEIGWNSSDPGMSAEIQSNYTMRALLLAMAYGVEKVFFYWLKDTRDSLFGTTGWLDSNWVPKQVYIDMEQLMSNYQDFEFDSWLSGPGNNHVAMLLRNGANRVRVEWNADNSTSDVGGNQVTGKPLFNVIIGGNPPPPPPPPPPAVRTIDLDTCLPNIQAGGTWSYGIVGTSPNLPQGMSLQGSTLSIDANAAPGHYPFKYTFEKNANVPVLSACQAIHIKIGV